MSVSVQSNHTAGFERFRPMDSTARFTAVNGSTTPHSQEQGPSFTWRPDPSQAVATTSALAQPSPAAPAQHDQPGPGTHGYYDNNNHNINNVGKRKRSPDDDDTRVEQSVKRDIANFNTSTNLQDNTDPRLSINTSRVSPTPASSINGSGSAAISRNEDTYPSSARMTTSPPRSDVQEPPSNHADSAQMTTSPSQMEQPETSPSVQEIQPHMREGAVKKRTFTHRTKTGCHTCRRRKKKCDEGKPICTNCLKGSFHCDGYGEKKIVSPSRGSNSRGRSSTGGALPSLSSPFQQRIAPISNSADSYPRFTQPNRRATEGLSSIESWQASAKQHAEQSMSPYPLPSHHSSNSVIRPTFGFPPRDLDRPNNRALTTMARQGTAMAPVTNPSTGRQTMNIGPSPTSIITTDPSDRTRERRRMFSGQPYLHYCDAQLNEDRRECRAALERYNNSTKPSVGSSDEECGRLFKSVIMPELRRAPHSDGRPSGTIGRTVTVEAPFTCEYGYNIHLGDDVILGSNCTMQDASRINIGPRTVIGPNVKFYTMTLPVDRRARGGSRTMAVAAPITIEEDCFIGADVIILAGRRIGRGSTIGAGTVVSKDVPEECVAAGNPLRILRSKVKVTDDATHNPENYQNEDVATLMIKPRGYLLTAPS